MAHAYTPTVGLSHVISCRCAIRSEHLFIIVIQVDDIAVGMLRLETQRRQRSCQRLVVETHVPDEPSCTNSAKSGHDALYGAEVEAPHPIGTCVKIVGSQPKIA